MELRKKIKNSSVLIVLIFGTIISLYFLFFFNEPFQDYDFFYQIIITVIGGILGLIIVVTMFYLGKFHDYNLEIMKEQMKLEERYELYKISYNQCTKKIEDLKNKSKLKKILEQILKQSDKIEKEHSIYEKHYENIKIISEKSEKYTEKTIKDFVKHLIPFVIVFIVSVIVKTETTQGEFYFVVIYLGLTILNFFDSWYLHEERMKGFRVLMKGILTAAKTFKITNRQIEELTEMIEEVTKSIKEENEQKQE